MSKEMLKYNTTDDASLPNRHDLNILQITPIIYPIGYLLHLI